MEHTKLPWKHNGNSNGIHTQEGHCIATTHNGDMKWNDAAFIHLACSNHQKLVDALEKLIDLHNYQESDGPKPTYEQWKTAFESAQQLLNEITK